MPEVRGQKSEVRGPSSVVHSHLAVLTHRRSRREHRGHREMNYKQCKSVSRPSSLVYRPSVLCLCQKRHCESGGHCISDKPFPPKNLQIGKVIARYYGKLNYIYSTLNTLVMLVISKFRKFN